jgi:methionyl-tRNA formyltransferase
MIKTLFLGSNYEALETLQILCKNPSFDIVGVITQPDKPFGRRQQIMPTVVKQHCFEGNLKIFHTNRQVEKYKEVLEETKPDLIVCKSFGEILPKFFLDYPKYGAINIHFSLLPKYRGAIPIQKAILDGEQETGISIIKMSEKLDAGDILTQVKEPILDNDTNESLRKRLVQKATQILPNTLKKWVAGEIKPYPQNEQEATFCWKEEISREKAEIKWDVYEAEYIERMIRAFLPWPVAWTTINGKKTKIFSAEAIDIEKLSPKEFLVENNNLFVGTKKGTLKICELQMEGKKKIPIQEFLNGTVVISIQ